MHPREISTLRRSWTTRIAGRIGAGSRGERLRSARTRLATRREIPGTYTPSIRESRERRSARDPPSFFRSSTSATISSTASSPSPTRRASKKGATGAGFRVHTPPATTRGCPSDRSFEQEGNPGKVEHREDVRVGEFVAQGEPEEVERPGGSPRFERCERQPGGAQVLLVVGPGGEDAIAKGPGPRGEDLAQEQDPEVRHPDLVHVGKGEQHAHARFVPRDGVEDGLRLRYIATASGWRGGFRACPSENPIIFLKTQRIHVTLSRRRMGYLRLFGTMGAEASFREEDFFGREEELSALTRAALEGSRGIGSSFMIYGPPNIGKTSLLLKLAKVLGTSAGGDGLPRPFPLYFSFSQILSHPLALSQHFLQEFLSQLLRFLGDARPSAFDPAAMCDRLASFGVTGCREVLAAHERCTAEGDGLSALVNALSFPFSASGELFYPVFLFDDFQYTGKLQGVPEGAMLSILRPYIKASSLPDVPLGLLARPRHRRPQARGALRHLPDDRSGRAIDRLLRSPVGAPVRAAPCRYPGVPPSPRLRAARRDPHVPADVRGGDLLPWREGPRRGHPREPVRVLRHGGEAQPVLEGVLREHLPGPRAGEGGRSVSSSASCATDSRSTRWKARSR